jgi:hypothetical protein
MKKTIGRLAILAIFLGFSHFTLAQGEIDVQDAVAAYFNAKLCEDYETMLGYTYPDVVEKAGGIDNVRKALIQIQETQKKKGFILQEYKTKPALQQVVTGEETHAIVPVTTVSKVPGGKVITETNVIAVGTEKNTRWYIIETTALDDGNVSKVLATWDNTMLLPFKKAPVFKEDK